MVWAIRPELSLPRVTFELWIKADRVVPFLIMGRVTYLHHYVSVLSSFQASLRLHPFSCIPTAKIIQSEYSTILLCQIWAIDPNSLTITASHAMVRSPHGRPRPRSPLLCRYSSPHTAKEAYMVYHLDCGCHLELLVVQGSGDGCLWEYQ